MWSLQGTQQPGSHQGSHESSQGGPRLLFVLPVLQSLLAVAFAPWNPFLLCAAESLERVHIVDVRCVLSVNVGCVLIVDVRCVLIVNVKYVLKAKAKGWAQALLTVDAFLRSRRMCPPGTSQW